MSDTTTAIAPIISATDEIASQFMAILFLVWCGRLTTGMGHHQPSSITPSEGLESATSGHSHAQR
jgi:hypothetical protein